MNFLVAAIAFVLGGVTTIALEIRGLTSFIDRIQDSLSMLFR